MALHPPAPLLVRGPAGKCSFRYRVSRLYRCVVVPGPSKMPCVRFGYSIIWNGLSGRDERVDQLLGALVVHVVVARAVDDEQIAAQPVARS